MREGKTIGELYCDLGGVVMVGDADAVYLGGAEKRREAAYDVAAIRNEPIVKPLFGYPFFLTFTCWRRWAECEGRPDSARD